MEVILQGKMFILTGAIHNMNLIEKLKERMDEKGIRTLVISKESNLNYLLQKEISGFLVIKNGSVEFLTGKFFTHSEIDVPVKILDGYEIKKEIKKLGRKIYSDSPENLNTKAIKSDIVEEMRELKEKFEIERIKKACEISSRAMNVAKEMICEKDNVWNVIAEIDHEIRRNKCYNAFNTLVSINALEPHQYPLDKFIGYRDIIIVDLGARYNFYCSDMTRTFCLNPDRKIQLIYEIILNLQGEIIDRIEIDMKLKDLENFLVDRLNKELKKFKISVNESYLHSLGHGVGIEVHERPFFNSSAKFRENQIIAIEPAIYCKGMGGIRIEDTILIKDKPEILTEFPKDLF